MHILLVGCGKMGHAMIRGWVTQHAFSKLTIVDPAGENTLADLSGIDVHTSTDTLPSDIAPDMVIFAVKPQVMDTVAPFYKQYAPSAVFLSIAAGRTIASFESILGHDAKIIRAMPNTPAAISQGITALIANEHVTATEIDAAEKLLRAVGDVVRVKTENEMDAVTALSGSGPAYVFLLIEAMQDAGVALGLAPDIAAKLAHTTVTGSAALAAAEKETEPATLRQNVTSPGGTTAAALSVLMAEDGLGALMKKALGAAAKRSSELSS